MPETLETPNSSFSKLLPRLQLSWDSTSLGELKLCPRRYQYSIIEGWAEQGESVHLKFGLIYHAALELHDKAQADGRDCSEAANIALRYALSATWDDALGRPWSSDHSNKNRETLIRSIIYYLDDFSKDSLETLVLSNGRAAVELSFSFKWPWRETVEGEEFSLCGHVDRVVKFQNEIWVTDKKTTKNTINQAYFARFSPDNQVSLYSFAGRVIFGTETKGMIIDAAQILVEDTRFQRGFIDRKTSTIDEWIEDTDHYLALAEHYARRNYWPQNDKNCSGVYLDPVTGEPSFGCPFRPVCASAPEIRPDLLRLNYTKRVWDPIKVRNGTETRTEVQLEPELEPA